VNEWLTLALGKENEDESTPPLAPSLPPLPPPPTYLIPIQPKQLRGRQMLCQTLCQNIGSHVRRRYSQHFCLGVVPTDLQNRFDHRQSLPRS
jgi:hypothetical protein